MATLSNSDIPQPLWERAVALVQKQDMPVNASSIQSAMNMLAEGGSGAADTNVGDTGGSALDALMARTDKAPVTSAPLQAPLPTQKPSRLDDHAQNNLENEQGPAKLNSHDAEAPDARGSALTAADAANAAPGTQGMNDMGLEDVSAVGDMGGGDATDAGILATLIATLTKRKNAPSLGQSIHLGDAMARPAISEFEGMIKPATGDEMKKSRRGRSGTGGGGRRNKAGIGKNIDQTLESLLS